MEPAVKRAVVAVLALAVVAAIAVAIQRTNRTEVLILPPGYPRPVIPSSNPLSAEKVRLGRHLFYERRLSINETQSCADCHPQSRAFSDPRPLSLGATGQSTRRNAMSLTNVAYNARLTWADPSVTSLEQQILIPLTHTHPIEMGIDADRPGVMARLLTDARYVRRFRAAFPEESQPVHLENVVRAIASFVRTLNSFDAPYDRHQRGDGTAMSPAALRGLILFESERMKCIRCHGGIHFRFTLGHRRTDDDTSVAYHNTGLYNLAGTGDYPPRDQGIYQVSREKQDMGRFKAPTLRNIEVTGPYMHDGSLATLDEVIDHYAAGGRTIRAGADAGNGSTNPYKSDLVSGFSITADEKADLIAFLHSLTDTTFLNNPAFAKPDPNED